MNSELSIDQLQARLAALERENEELRIRVGEAEQTLQAIHEGQIDALVVSTPEGEKVYTLEGADRPYRTLIEQMQEGAVTLIRDGTIHYCNRAFADMLKRPLEAVLGSRLSAHIHEPDRPAIAALLDHCMSGTAKGEANLCAVDGSLVPVHIGLTLLVEDGQGAICMVVTDLSARKRIEQLLASEQHYRVLFERNPAGVFAVDAAGRFILANPACERISGYSIPELLHKTFMSLCAPDQLEKTLAAFQRGLVERVYLEFETALVHRDGHRVDLWLSGEPVFDGSQLIAIHCTANDITERKSAAQALLESGERLRLAMMAARLLAFEWDPRTDIVNRDGDSEAILGVPLNQETGAAFFARLHSEDRESFVRMVRSLSPANDSYAVTYRALRPGGGESVLEESGRAFFDGQGRLVRLIGMTADITARRRAEESLAAAHAQIQSLIDNTPAIVYALDLEERFILANAALAAVLNTTPQQMIGKRRRELMPMEDAEKHEANDRKAIEAGKAIEFEEYNQLDGRSITWLTTKFPLRDAQGRIYAVAGISADISERKAAEEALQAAKLSADHAKAAAETANKAKDQFIAVLSHELRTPLTPAAAALALLRTDMRLPIDVRDDLALVSRNIDLEIRLIADLLDVSRIISGKLHIEKRPADVADAIREAAAIVSGDLDAKGQSLTVETPDSPYPMVADAARLQQVFWNVLRNSIKFSPERGHIAIRARVVPPSAAGRSGAAGHAAAAELIVEVIDHGTGIAPEMLPKLFSAFAQDESARCFGGLGLGLSICKAVVEAHGGTICAHSEGAGRGATFIVRLPLAAHKPSSTDGSTHPSTRSTSVEPAPRAASPLRVLLVEDHTDTAKLMRRLLMADGHEVVVARCVAEGLAAVERSRPDIMISDLGLPDGSGLDLMRQLLAQGHQIPAIALSGYGTAADIEKSKSAGFREHLVKPLSSLEALADAIARLGPRRR